MSRPLYKAASSEPNVCPCDGHAGLWFDKFCNIWGDDGDRWAMPAKKKLLWIKTALVRSPIGDRGHIREFARRQARMVERLGGRFAVFSTESHFVTGLGRNHPVENGFTWHPVLGVPYLPGSSVKGLLRAWVKRDAEPCAEIGMQDQVFGECDRAGSICFLDAVPTGPVQLAADVMTPHYAGWTTDNPPGDWRSPTPIPFLVTAQTTPFLFGFAPRRPLADDDLSTVFEWLSDALEWAGGGAKTAVGYGRFRHDDKQTRDLRQLLEDEEHARREEQERKQIEKTPEGRWRLEVKGRSEADVLELVRIHLEKKRLSDPDERQAFARAVSTLHPDWVERWRRGIPDDPRTNVGRKKLKERARLLNGEFSETGSH